MNQNVDNWLRFYEVAMAHEVGDFLMGFVACRTIP